MSKLFQALIENVNQREILDWAEGNSAVLAVTKERVYLVKTNTWSRPNIKSYDIRSITSLHLQKPGFMAGHMQIIASGVGDKTKSLSSAFDYAKDENTIMIKDNYDHFLRLEQLIYKQKEPKNESTPPQPSEPEEDVFMKLQKLKGLVDAEIISQEEYEEKRLELLARI
ncbi:SHOCT domain-containing protein [Paenibacillus albidus]|uniref:SHOCT domain-containing protein n=1 Tax=Paenibacillus albidus TaxID=2041023 RepID=UPI001BE79CFD|nr:SHOCT domain-containing protein [Paenibacillus albidus]MBT2288508.1 SHOCT domain-containing protein [Paenibacillus albidus]